MIAPVDDHVLDTVTLWQQQLRRWVLRTGVAEVCVLLEVHKTTVYKWIRVLNPALPRADHRRQLEELMGVRRRRAS